MNPFEDTMAYHNQLGKLGEQIAVEHLISNGYIVLERNFVYDKAEVDIIAENEAFMVVIEVKTRNSTYFGNPQEFVSRNKIKLLLKAANEYVIRNKIEKEIRFDIISVIKNRHVQLVEHFRDAFYHF